MLVCVCKRGEKGLWMIALSMANSFPLLCWPHGLQGSLTLSSHHAMQQRPKAEWLEGGVGCWMGGNLCGKSSGGGHLTPCFNLFNHHLFFYYLHWLCAWLQISDTLLKLSGQPRACGSQHGHLDTRELGPEQTTHILSHTRMQMHRHILTYTHRKRINILSQRGGELNPFILFCL